MNAIPEVLSVRLQPKGASVKLAELKCVAEHLQRTLDKLATTIAGDKGFEMAYEIVAASVGSLSLALRPVAPPDSTLRPEAVIATFADDLAAIRQHTYRPGLTTGLTREYLALVRTLGASDIAVEYRYGDRFIRVDGEFRAGFEVALEERIVEDVSMAGTLEAVNVHRSPFQFNLYPKLPGSDRVECRFPQDMLPVVAELLRSRSMVRVTGRAHFLPVGLYPSHIDVSEAPTPVGCARDVLRSAVRRFPLVPEGVTAAEYLQRNREAAGYAE